METITVLLCPAGKKPELIEISNDMPVIQDLLEGILGVKELDADGICLIYNESGDKKALEINRVIQGETIYGSCIFCRKAGDKLASLNEDEIKDLVHLLA